MSAPIKYRETLPSEMSLEEILGAGIAEHAARAQAAEARAHELETRCAALELELSEVRSGQSEPPSGLDVKTSSGHRLRGERWTAVVVSIAVMVTVLLWRLPAILESWCH